MSALLLSIVREALDRGASDVHLTTDNPPVLRINGDVVVTARPALDEATLTRALDELLEPRQRTQWLTTRRLSFAWCPPELGVFRVSIYSHLGRMEAALRIGRKEIPAYTDLGVPEGLVEHARAPSGLILVTGPTGVGKTTTLNAVLAELHRTERRKIITIEDPVEFRMPPGRSLVVQQEIGLDSDTFHGALVHALRQDPDTICIGEMRDLETIGTALTAAETGHLVMGTLHTTGAVGTITRIIDVFPPHQQPQIRVQLAQTLRIVMSQRLLPRADGRGRVMVYELVPVTAAVRNIIREGRLHQLENVIQTGRSMGMIRMEHMVRDAYHQGLISKDVASRAVVDPSALDEPADEHLR
ncbi:MAG: PilT/PilU family type 4a pilus ATPase [bacterium]